MKCQEAVVCVKDLDMFVTVQLLEDTAAVLSLGKLCEQNGSSHEWNEGMTPKLEKNLANAIISCQPSFLVDQGKYTFQAQQKSQLKASRS